VVSFILAFPPISWMHSSSTHSCYMSCPSHPPWLDHSNYAWRRVQAIFSSAPCSQTLTFLSQLPRANSDILQSFIQAIRPGPRPLWHFVTSLLFYADMLVPRSTPKLEDHPLSAVRDCLLKMLSNSKTEQMGKHMGPSQTCTGLCWNENWEGEIPSVRRETYSSTRHLPYV
jgi:hypothetical protein